jgi:hypothetical protein
MPMDGITVHLLARLDAIRETQLAHGQLIQAIAAGMARPRAASIPPTPSRESWMKIAAGAGQWAGGVLALAYLLRGGDLATAMALLQKLF